MKKYILILLGVFLLLLDIRIGVTSYPAFIDYPTEAPETVDMVIRHVIGTDMVIDIASDLIGFILIIIGSVFYYIDTKKTNDISPSQTTLYLKRWKNNILWSLAGSILYVLERIMPFFYNQNLRYRAEYLLYFLLLAAEVAAAYGAFLGLCKQLDNAITHTVMNPTIIFAMLSIGCFGVARVLFFYELNIVFATYYVLCLLFYIIACVRLRKMLK